MNNPFYKLDKGKIKVLEILNAIACFWILILMILIAVDVFGRVLFNMPFKGTPELVSNSIIAIAFLEIPFVLHRGDHVRSTILLDKIKPGLRTVMELIAIIIGIVMFVLLIKSSWPDFIKALKVGEFEGEGALRVPTTPARAAIIIGSFLMIVEYIFLFVKKVLKSKGKSEENDIDKGGDVL